MLAVNVGESTRSGDAGTLVPLPCTYSEQGHLPPCYPPPHIELQTNFPGKERERMDMSSRKAGQEIVLLGFLLCFQWACCHIVPDSCQLFIEFISPSRIPLAKQGWGLLAWCWSCLRLAACFYADLYEKQIGALSRRISRDPVGSNHVSFFQ